MTQGKVKIKRQPDEAHYCKYCGEPKTLGNHAIPLKMAEQIEKEKCGKCDKETLASCVLGIGHFMYLCENGHRWSNLERLR